MPQIGGPTVLKLLSTVPNTSTGILYCILVDLSTVGGGRCCGKKLVCRGTRTVVGSKATGGLVCRLLGPIKGMDVTGGSAAAATTQKTWARGGRGGVARDESQRDSVNEKPEVWHFNLFRFSSVKMQ